LKYVHQNPVHHGIVSNAELYPWCSAAWFARHAQSAFFKTVNSFRIDRLQVRDDFEVEPIACGRESGVKPPHSEKAAARPVEQWERRSRFWTAAAGRRFLRIPC
jgi:hypothetical protein